jgi:hypothetical protein
MLKLFVTCSLLLSAPVSAQTYNPKNTDDLYSVCQLNMLEISKGNPDFLAKATHLLPVDDRLYVRSACILYYQGILDGMRLVLAIKETKPK